MKRLIFAAAALALLVGHSGRSQAGPIYSTTGDGTGLATINQTTGAGTVVGPSGTFGTFAAAFNSSGTLYTIIGWSTGTNRLATFNQTTGAATQVSGTTFGDAGMLALQFKGGTLYGGSMFSDIFYTINAATGAATAVGSMGTGGQVMDFALDGSGQLWAVNNTVFPGGQLWKIDTTTGAGTLVSTITGTDGNVMGIMFDASGTLYATDYTPNSKLYTINTATGVATTVGTTGLFFAHGGDFQAEQTAVPAPAGVTLFGLGALGLFGCGWRRKKAAALPA
jgi:hypothetical protein